MIRPWDILDSKELANYRIFRLQATRKVNPRNGYEHEFIVAHAPNWVNVVALTEEKELIIVEQFRHGSGTIEKEIPGGVMDKTDDSPLAAGLRELLEETGYVGENARVIGQVFSNPAIMNNTTFTVLVENCRKVQEVELDQGEDLMTHLVPLTDVRRLASEGHFGHSLVLAALYHYELNCDPVRDRDADRQQDRPVTG
jgi:ADP-ribose pyrophosphatase